MYDLGWFMVYPNLPDHLVLATNHLMKGEHKLPPRDKFELPLLEDDPPDLEKLLHVPPLSSMHVFNAKVERVEGREALNGASVALNPEFAKPFAVR